MNSSVAIAMNEDLVIAYATGEWTTPLSQEQRNWLIDEAVSCGEGEYSREKLESESDRDLATACYWAWKSYVDSNF